GARAQARAGWFPQASVTVREPPRLGLTMFGLGTPPDLGGEFQFPITMGWYGFQVGLFLFAARRSGNRYRATRAWTTRWGKASSAAWGDRFGQDVHDGESYRAPEPRDAGACA